VCFTSTGTPTRNLADPRGAAEKRTPEQEAPRPRRRWHQVFVRHRDPDGRREPAVGGNARRPQRADDVGDLGSSDRGALDSVPRPSGRR
jgi:hypothetical protein